MIVDLHTLLLGDCLERMAEIPSGSVDLVLTDPPYGTTACKWDAVIPFGPMWDNVRRVLKPNGAAVFTASQPFTSALVMSNPSWFKYEWLWLKNRATGHVHAKNKPMKRQENVVVFSSGSTIHASQSANRMPYFPQGLIPVFGKTRRRNDAGDDAVMSARSSHMETQIEFENYPDDILEFSIEMGSARFHPTQKPVALMDYLIRTYTNEGDTVLDFTMGSGTTGVACANTGRKFIGIEREPKYFAIAEKRIAEAYGMKADVQYEGVFA